jgi:hypothetical protein
MQQIETSFKQDNQKNVTNENGFVNTTQFNIHNSVRTKQSITVTSN